MSIHELVSGLGDKTIYIEQTFSLKPDFTGRKQSRHEEETCVSRVCLKVPGVGRLTVEFMRLNDLISNLYPYEDNPAFKTPFGSLIVQTVINNSFPYQRIATLPLSLHAQLRGKEEQLRQSPVLRAEFPNGSRFESSPAWVDTYGVGKTSLVYFQWFDGLETDLTILLPQNPNLVSQITFTLSSRSIFQR